MEKRTIKQKAAKLSQANYKVFDSSIFVTGVGESQSHDTEYLDNLGSILNFTSIEQVNRIKNYRAMKKLENPLFMMDVIHGAKTIFPIPLGQACSWDLDLVERCASIAAKEANSYGIDVTFSPMVDLVRDPRWGRVAESYGEDPYLNGLMGSATIKGYQKEGVSACVKHFCAYGAAEAGREYNLADVSEQTLRNYYLKPYQICLEAKPDMIMSSFNNLNGIPVNGNRHVMVDILRKEWNFDGVVITDYFAISEMVNHHYVKDDKQAASIAINNEIDVEMVSNTYYRYLDELVKEGKVSEKLIDKSIERFDKLSNKHNSINKPSIPLYSKEALLVAEKMSDESIVLLKNAHSLLPLNKKEKICFIGPHLSSHDLFGTWACYRNMEITKTIGDEIKDFLNKDTSGNECCELGYFVDEYTISNRLKEEIKNSDKIVMFVGEKSEECGESKSKTNISLPIAQKELIKEVSSYGKPIVLVILSGRPLVLKEECELADSILFVYFLGSLTAKSIVKTLYGDNNPSGKITMSFPRSVGQIPIYYNNPYNGRNKPSDDLVPPQSYCSSYLDERNAPLFPFGFGLSYSSYEYSNLKINNNKLRKDSCLSISVDVTNTSKIDGYEIVQVYFHDCYGSIVKPRLELVNFKRVFIKANEKVTLSFEIPCSCFSFYDNEGKLNLETGDMKIFVGGSSVSLLEENFEIVD